MSSSVVLRLLNPAVQNQLLERLNKCGQLTFFHHRNYKLQEHFPCIIITITVNAVRAVFILPHVSNTRWHCSQTRSTLYWTSSHHLPSSNLVQTPQTMSTSQKVQPSLIHTPVIANFDSKPIPSSGDIKQHRVHSGFVLKRIPKNARAHVSNVLLTLVNDVLQHLSTSVSTAGVSFSMLR